MIYLNKQILVVLLVALTMLMGCKESSKTSSSSHPINDTIEFDGHFFENEKIKIMANDSTIFIEKIDSIKSKKLFYGEFIIEKKDTVKLQIQSSYKGKIVIDTTFIIPPAVYINSIGTSICYPKNLSEDSIRKLIPKWGYLPIDSCKRLVTLLPDSVMYKFERY